MAGRGRPAGSTNKSPFRLIELETLTNLLQPNVKIPVKKEFLDALLTDEQNIEEYDTTSIAKSKVEQPEPVLPIVRHTPLTKGICKSCGDEDTLKNGVCYGCETYTG